MNWAHRALAWLERVENIALALLALSLILLASAQVFLRMLGEGLIWLDPLLRALVMWTAMLGAIAATRRDKHINLDALTRTWTGLRLRIARFLAFGFGAAICVVLADASYELVKLDRESATLLIDGIPAWWTETILPVGFALMAFRFALRAFAPPLSMEAAP